jgi:hypothetical protein
VPGEIPLDELAHLPVTADLAGARVVDHHLARPCRLQVASVTVVQGSEVLPDRVGAARLARLLARQRRGTGEFREPRHATLHAHLPAGQFPATAIPMSSGNILVSTPAE